MTITTTTIANSNTATKAEIRDVVNTEQLPMLMIGGDHPYDQWYGTDGTDGEAAMYLDKGIKPYCAVNTQISSVLPGSSISVGQTNCLTWAQMAELEAAGVDFTSHGVWHVQQWDRLNTGFSALYSGAGSTATIEVTATDLVGSVDAGVHADSFSFSLASYTVETLIAAVNAKTGWSSELAEELTGDEPATVLPRVAARSCLSLMYVAASAGISIHYPVNAEADYVDVCVTISASGNFYLYADGNTLLANALSDSSVDTLTELVSEIRSALSGVECYVCDNDEEGAGNPTYSVGDEYSTGLADSPVLGVDVTQHPVALSIGLGHGYLLNRHMLATKAIADTNSVTLGGFQQSGNGFLRQFGEADMTFDSYRGNPLDSGIKPKQFIPGAGSFYTYQDVANGLGYTTVASMTAIIDALADSPGFGVCCMSHDIDPDGTTGYVLSDNWSPYDATEADYNAFLLYIKSAVDAGLIQIVTPSTYQKIAGKIPSLRQFLFNPKLKHSGVSLTGLVAYDGGAIIPGWNFAGGISNLTAASISDDVLTVTSDADDLFVLMQQNVKLEPGCVYRLSATCEVDATSGNGIKLTTIFDGRFPNTSRSYTSDGYSGIEKLSMGEMDLTFVMPPLAGGTKPRMWSKDGPFDLSSLTNIKMRIQPQSDVDNIDVSDGAFDASAATAAEVAAAINAAMATQWGADYGDIAHVDGDKFYIEAPYQYFNTDYDIRVRAASSSSATGVLFEVNGDNYAFPQTKDHRNPSNYPVGVRVMMAMTGTAKISNLSLVKVSRD